LPNDLFVASPSRRRLQTARDILPSGGQRSALGFVEGLNNTIRAIQRRAYGYRDEEYFRLKILTCMLPKL
jgi:transposase